MKGKNIAGALAKIAAALRTSVYTLRYYHGKLSDKEILLWEGKSGKSLNFLEQELRTNPAYSAYRVCRLRGEGPRVAWHWGGAKYILVSGRLPDWWTKRDGMLLCYAASVPAKKSFDLDGVQRACLSADFVLCPDAATRDRLTEACDLGGLFAGKYICSEDPVQLCRALFMDACEAIGGPSPGASTGKENVLLLCGGLRKNGLTTALINLLKELDLARRNYWLSYPASRLEDEPARLERIPAGVHLLPLPQMHQESALEKLATLLYFQRDVEWCWVMRLVERYFSRLYRRSYAGCDFRCAIDCDGYNPFAMNMLLYGRQGSRAVYVHSDMLREMETRHNQHRPTLEKVYRSFERVLTVTEDILAPTAQLSGRRDNIRVVNSCHDWRGVRARAQEELHFDADTACNRSPEEVKQILESGVRKFLTIGRYSPEKGHDRLLEAFARFHGQFPESHLMIIGGHGELYGSTLRLAKALGCDACVTLIRSMSNPMPILRRCDLFLLSSHYEGLGLVLLEADSLGVPTISTDIPGPRGFMKAHGGTLVPPSAEGLYQGMLAFMEGKVKAMHVDYATYNREAVRQFEEAVQELSADVGMQAVSSPQR